MEKIELYAGTSENFKVPKTIYSNSFVKIL